MWLAQVPAIQPALTLKPMSPQLAELVAAARREMAEAEWRLVPTEHGLPVIPPAAEPDRRATPLPDTANRLDRRA